MAIVCYDERYAWCYADQILRCYIDYFPPRVLVEILFNCINGKSGIVVSRRDFEEMYEPFRGKQQCGFRTGPTQTDLYSHRKELEA